MDNLKKIMLDSFNTKEEKRKKYENNLESYYAWFRHQFLGCNEEPSKIYKIKREFNKIWNKLYKYSAEIEDKTGIGNAEKGIQPFFKFTINFNNQKYAYISFTPVFDEGRKLLVQILFHGEEVQNSLIDFTSFEFIDKVYLELEQFIERLSKIQ